MESEHRIEIFINKKKYHVEHAEQTGASLKHLAGIPLNDVLFLQRHGEDEVIPNEKKISVKNGGSTSIVNLQPTTVSGQRFLRELAFPSTALRSIRRLADGRFL